MAITINQIETDTLNINNKGWKVKGFLRLSSQSFTDDDKLINIESIESLEKTCARSIIDMVYGDLRKPINEVIYHAKAYSKYPDEIYALEKQIMDILEGK